MIDRLLHEKDLVEAHPEEMTHILFQAFFHQVGKDPIEIELPPDHAGCDLVDQGLVALRDPGRGEMPVDRLIEQPSLFYLIDDLEA